ncbi:hypothetical protein O6H91_07G081600 [Diphasiastrum complanatum]|uniref:Uncharacterized protein n=1 Tax=Diphasiastrum complanatum TaxID=34168 RepID=A0ACC2D7A1_DIPCM|nr:hypothetical protein O6H91_07G081600 [Diphasiastrum complanatum]
MDAVKTPAPVEHGTLEKNEKWKIGFAPVDIHGRQLLDLSNKGGWKACIFIFGNEVAERMVFFGIAANYVTFLFSKFHQSFPDSVNMTTNFLGTSCTTPLIGAFLADAYLGRYWTIAIFSVIYMGGLICLTVSAALPSLKPSEVGCTPLNNFLGVCTQPSAAQMGFLYFGLYVVALGSGGIRPCVSAFGADQFNANDPSQKKMLGVFFNLFYFMIAVGMVFSLTGIVYIQDYVGWGWGIGVLAVAMAVANVIYFLGTPLYRHKLPSGSPLTRIAQVIVSAWRKRGADIPADETLLYEVYDRESAILGSRKLLHTRFFRFLDKAAVETEVDNQMEAGASIPVSPWKLCTVTQVEELKSLLRMAPICATSIIVNTVFFQLVNFSVQQGLTMDRRLSRHFVVPAASIPVFAALFILVIMPLYDRLYVPILRRFTGHPRGTTLLQRIGIGLTLSTISVVIAAVVERKRRQLAYSYALEFNPIAIIPFSAFWLVIPYSLVGMAEIFAAVGQLEFFYDQAPDGMRSLGTALFSVAAAAGSFIASLLVTIVKRVTKNSNSDAWVSNNINTGHLDYYYWLLAVLSVINLLLFVIVAPRYEYKVNITDQKQKQQLVSNDNLLFQG